MPVEADAETKRLRKYDSDLTREWRWAYDQLFKLRSDPSRLAKVEARLAKCPLPVDGMVSERVEDPVAPSNTPVMIENDADQLIWSDAEALASAMAELEAMEQADEEEAAPEETPVSAPPAPRPSVPQFVPSGPKGGNRRQRRAAEKRAAPESASIVSLRVAGFRMNRFCRPEPPRRRPRPFGRASRRIRGSEAGENTILKEGSRELSGRIASQRRLEDAGGVGCDGNAGGMAAARWRSGTNELDPDTNELDPDTNELDSDTNELDPDTNELDPDTNELDPDSTTTEPVASMSNGNDPAEGRDSPSRRERVVLGSRRLFDQASWYDPHFGTDARPRDGEANLHLRRRAQRRPARGQPDPGASRALARCRIRGLWRAEDGRGGGDPALPAGRDGGDVVPAGPVEPAQVPRLDRQGRPLLPRSQARRGRPDRLPGAALVAARKAKARGVPVFYFVPPQLWAWAGWRVKKVRRFVDHVLCSLPFEPAWYQARGVENAVYVGHPYFDELAERHLDGDFILAQKARRGSDRGDPPRLANPGGHAQPPDHAQGRRQAGGPAARCPVRGGRASRTTPGPGRAA